MKTVINRKTVLWAIGVLQPVSAEEISTYFKTVLSNAGRIPGGSEIHGFCLEASDKGQLVRVWRKPDLFALTLQGNRYLSDVQRKARDKARIFLLRDARKDRVYSSREVDATGLGGAAPSVDARSTLKGTEANRLGLFVPQGRPYWPRFSQQLSENTGPSPSSRDIFPLLLLFASPEQLAHACQAPVASLALDLTTLGLMLGISPKLIQQISRRPERHYRSFELPKRAGGVRPIDSPRVFLKVIQQFLADYVLAGLPVSQGVYSYRAGTSIVDNARQHVGKDYVANIDIENFFGSIQRPGVEALLASNGLNGVSAALIGKLVTKDGVLPQGAPTSPAISNAFLLSFDEVMLAGCRERDLAYSRYADDITVSGADRNAIADMIEVAREQLAAQYGLRLNEKKTRIASRHGQQKVTGVVVNEKILPPRTFRRQVRAAFHNAYKQGRGDLERCRGLAGYLSYLKSFDELRGSPELAKYETTLRGLRRKRS